MQCHKHHMVNFALKLWLASKLMLLLARPMTLSFARIGMQRLHTNSSMSAIWQCMTMLSKDLQLHQCHDMRSWCWAGWVAAVQSAPNQPPQLQGSHTGGSKAGADWEWHAIQTIQPSSLPPDIASHLEKLSFQTIKVGRNTAVQPLKS